MWILQLFLDGGTKYPLEEIQRQRVKQKLKERPSRDCSLWESIPYTDTKPRHFVDAKKCLLTEALYSFLLRGSASLTTIGQSMGYLMEDLEKGLKELKGFATP